MATNKQQKIRGITRTEFVVGTKHTAVLGDVTDKGKTINFNEDIVAFVPNRHLEKEDGSTLKKEKKLNSNH